ncbi:putative CBS domain-containing protein [Medicago truncatula]|uniref:Cystathionine beta-synthase (CBS) family protein n=1 Tax=Medicago truncatula TaxID=3880 RepID=A0A072VAY1_MEDTR|nr:CBS domain-containing protein CBSX5 [Medicago truncatula]KEH38766.1 cystathionine beta-synthase (CBS) family protein [Medicago truncatula]RHN75137.1 putative CBS domain-containing protein [Medicago truncatula]
MAVSFLAHELSELCLGKPPLKSISTSATIAEAIEVLRSSDDSFVSVWSCDHSEFTRCQCVGKVCMVDVICYLCKPENLLCPSKALNALVSVVLPKVGGLVVQLESSSSLLEAIDLILQGAQNLVVPILQTKRGGISRRKQQQKSSTINNHNGVEFCWLTQEDVIRFLLGSIGLFTPLPAYSIDSLDIISPDVLAIDYYSPASSAVEAISKSLAQQTSVAIVDSDDGTFVGEISPFTLACCDETVAVAITALSAGDLMAYIDCGAPPEDLVRLVKARLKEKNLEKLLQKFTILTSLTSEVSTSSSSDEEGLTRSGKHARSSSYSARFVRNVEAIVCHPKSSLIAVMIQAISHRVNYLWVIEDDCSLVGIVTFSNILKVFRERLEVI